MTRSSLFITGASGFIGRSLLHKLDGEKYNKIFCLIRNPHNFQFDEFNLNNVEIIEGDLLNPKKYQDYLKESDTVIHLAALTGKHKPEDYFKVNANGTKILVESCIKSGVKRFLYVSTIAVKFQEKQLYYYAQSKLQAEEIVKKSGLKYAIVRPTQVIGKTGTWWESFSKLAKAPVTIVFGDGKVKIQPIYLEDVSDCILSVVEENRFENQLFELGGPEQLTIEEFIKRIRHSHDNKTPRFIHISLKLIVPLLSFLEKYFYNLLPITAGQLASFKNDGTVSKDRSFANPGSNMKNINEIITLLENSV